ncbi:hypothetical protein B0J13DRAFT_584200 [Dactylonectria estremocensis]|uniref:Uncharacterized protein n=1 Tax=Dactylonectria estremocensis TaxID=1079267 RepID=A0A9P9EW35_9HYPO|nr:hypothetical protein B0J13DRAFT_584200 [Dactylonectria estremocensis]
MSRRAPAEKFLLAVRKNIRDSWENVREEREKKLSDVLGESWAIKVDPLTLYPYAEPDSWAQGSLGDIIAGYVAGVEYQLKYFLKYNREGTKTEINEICSAHFLTIDCDEEKKVTYCGCKISPAGELVVLFSEAANFTKALNEGPLSGKPMSYLARPSISKDYKPGISKAQEKLNKIPGQEIAIVPNVAKLKGDWKTRDDFEPNLGGFTYMYFEALNSYLESERFREDDMLREDLLEIVEGRAVHFRIVDALKRSYNETVVKDEILYLQTTPEYFSANVDYVAGELLNLL